MTYSRRLIALVAALMFAFILPTLAMAQDDNRAGLVILHGDGSTTTQCVSFSESEITGLQLLERSGLDLNYDASSFGAAVCRIDNEGCSFPQDSCFCQCEGNPCYFWSYWYQGSASGDWIYAPLGSGNRSLGNGDVDAWVWNLGSSPSGESVESEPPTVSFDDICASATATPTPTRPTQPESPIPSTPGPPIVITVIPPIPTATSIATPAPASEPVSIPEPITLVLFGSGLAGLGVQAWRKRKEENR